MSGVDVLAVLDSLQFGFNYRRCPLCAGWNVGPNGETDKVHTATCPVPQARVAIEELIEAARVLDNKAMQRTKLTASVYTSHVMRLRAALAAVSPK